MTDVANVIDITKQVQYFLLVNQLCPGSGVVHFQFQVIIEAFILKCTEIRLGLSSEVRPEFVQVLLNNFMLLVRSTVYFMFTLS